MKPKFKHGGKRPGSGRPRKAAIVPPPAPPVVVLVEPGPVDPIRGLEGIAVDPLQPANARVAAFKALLIHRESKPAQESADGIPDGISPIMRRALEMGRNRSIN